MVTARGNLWRRVAVAGRGPDRLLVFFLYFLKLGVNGFIGHHLSQAIVRSTETCPRVNSGGVTSPPEKGASTMAGDSTLTSLMPPLSDRHQPGPKGGA